MILLGVALLVALGAIGAPGWVMGVVFVVWALLWSVWNWLKIWAVRTSNEQAPQEAHVADLPDRS